MDRGPLSAKPVVDTVRAKLIPLRVYVDKHPETCSEYRVPNPSLRDHEGYAPYPSIQLWTPSGVLVTRIDGAVPLPRFRAWLTKGLAAWPAVARKETELLDKVANQPDLLGRHLDVLARFYAKHNTYRKAAETWTRLARLSTARPASRDLAALRAGHAYLMHASYPQANAVLSLAARDGAKTREQALYLMGFSCQQANQPDQAYRHFRELLMDFPGGKLAKDAKKALGNRKVFY